MKNKFLLSLNTVLITLVCLLIVLNLLVLFESKRFLEFEVLVDENEKSQLYADIYNIQLKNFIKPNSILDFNMAAYPTHPYRDKYDDPPPEYKHFLKIKLGDNEGVIALEGMFIWPDRY